MKFLSFLLLLSSFNAFGAKYCPTQQEHFEFMKKVDAFDLDYVNKILDEGYDPDFCQKNIGGTSDVPMGYMMNWFPGYQEQGLEVEFNNVIKRFIDLGATLELSKIGLKFGDMRLIDYTAQACNPEIAKILIDRGVKFDGIYSYSRFLVDTALWHTYDCGAIAELFFSKGVDPLGTDICRAYNKAEHEFDPARHEWLLSVGDKGMALPYFQKRIKEVYGWDTEPLPTTTSPRDFDFDLPYRKFCSKLLDRGIDPPVR